MRRGRNGQKGTKSPENAREGMKGNEMESNGSKGNEKAVNTITGYKIAQQANKVLEMEGLAPIKPQMVYNYIKNHLIPANGPNGTVIDLDATKWIVKYVNAKKARQTA